MKLNELLFQKNQKNPNSNKYKKKNEIEFGNIFIYHLNK